MEHRDITTAKEVLHTEIQGLEALINVLDDAYLNAVEQLFNTKGHVVLSGMGKSGHIAKKIAATMSSTGTPAIFVHPGEASHGDLGMITENDTVVLLSNSGETSELTDIITYCKRFAIPLIGIVRRKTSTLVEAADIALILPDVEEASPVNAPTTSTTMMLAWGDVLAVALLERRGFTKEHFNVFHPGGKLGKAFMRVSDIMQKGDILPIVPHDAPMSEVLITITQKSLGCALVVNKDNVLIGIITDGDLRRHMDDSIVGLKAQDVMSAAPKTIAPTALAAEALEEMQRFKITSLCVAVDNHIKGLIHIHDLLREGVA